MFNMMLLGVKYPKLESEFDQKLNKGIDFAGLTIGSRLSIWWRCPKGPDHIWLASPNQRTSGKKLRGCPICAGKKVVRSNSLANTYPHVACEWDDKENYPLTPYEITAGSNKKVEWRCSKDPRHSWQASPKQRTQQNNLCPMCSSLGYTYPDLAEQWHPAKNENITPYSVPKSSHRMIWWKCSNGFDHVWQATPNSRTSMLTGCPVCSGKKVVKSNSLAAMYPEIASQWYYKRNAIEKPENVYCRSHKKVWWKCPEGEDHIWAATIKSRANGMGCPVCSGRKVAKSNSLAVKNPGIAKFWHPTKNERLTPYDVTPFSGKTLWWRCPKELDHEWQATVANVVSGSTCPVCMNRKITESNNIFSLYPRLKQEWDYENNSNLNPQLMSAGSKIKAWWICKRDSDHKWYATITDRTKKDSGCPFCSIKLNISEIKMFDIIKSIFIDTEVMYRFKPEWLKRMELDVYIPDLEVGFEYQGVQHFKPIWHAPIKVTTV